MLTSDSSLNIIEMGGCLSGERLEDEDDDQEMTFLNPGTTEIEMDLNSASSTIPAITSIDNTRNLLGFAHVMKAAHSLIKL